MSNLKVEEELKASPWFDIRNNLLASFLGGLQEIAEGENNNVSLEYLASMRPSVAARGEGECDEAANLIAERLNNVGLWQPYT